MAYDNNITVSEIFMNYLKFCWILQVYRSKYISHSITDFELIFTFQFTMQHVRDCICIQEIQRIFFKCNWKSLIK